MDRRSVAIQQIIARTTTFFMARVNPVFRTRIINSIGVQSSGEGLGRDLKILKTYQGGLTGVIESATPRADFILHGEATSDLGVKLYLQSQNQTFPDALKGPNPRPYRLGINMHGFVTNLALSMSEHDLEALPANIAPVIAPKLVGFARNLARRISTYWYLSQNLDYRLCHITSVTAVTGAGPYTWTFQPDNQATSRFTVGDMIDIYTDVATPVRQNDTTGTVGDQLLTTALQAYVAAVDHMNNTVTVVSVDDPDADWVAAPANLSFIAYHNTRIANNVFTGLAGVNSWLKTGDGTTNDNFLLGAERDTSNAIDVTVHPEFKSFTKAVNAPLTEHYLRQVLARMLAALDETGGSLDTILCSEGVILAYLAQKIGRERIDRTGRVASLDNEGGGDEQLRIVVEGQTFTFYTDRYIESGTVYIMKVGNNWTMKVPPSGPGMQGFDRVDMPGVPFEFVAPALTGTGSSRMPILDTSGSHGMPTDFYQMPGRMRLQLIPEQTQMGKLTSVTESRLYSDN